MWYFLALVIDGALAGAIYALVALAFVLVYKASTMMNFALGEWLVFGAVLAGTGLHLLHLGTIGALIFAAIGMIALAAGFYRLVVRRLVARPALSAIMATLGLGMVMRGSGPLVFSGVPALFPASLLGEPVVIGDVSIAAGKLAAACVAALCVALIGGFWRFSRTGIALRAIANDPQAAMASGIDVDRQLLVVWSLAGMVAVVAGVLWTLVVGAGFGVSLIGLKVFPIVILGGLDSIAGSIVAAIAVGVLESLGAGYLDESLGPGFGSIAPYLVLLAMLMARPHGLFGQPRVERV
jgi:branched-chain amino acid transport system permease protein